MRRRADTLIESADEVFEHLTHLVVLDSIGVEIDFCEFRDDQVQTVGLLQSVDLGIEVETIEDVTHALREAVNVARSAAGKGTTGAEGRPGRMQATDWKV